MKRRKGKETDGLKEQEIIERRKKTARVNLRKHEERVEGIRLNKEAKRKEKQQAGLAEVYSKWNSDHPPATSSSKPKRKARPGSPLHGELRPYSYLLHFNPSARLHDVKRARACT